MAGRDVGGNGNRPPGFRLIARHNSRMVNSRVVAVACASLATAVVLSGQEPAPFRATIDFVTTDVIVRRDGKFVPGLQQNEFRVYEDDVPQTVTFFEPWIGGRSLGNIGTVPAAA